MPRFPTLLILVHAVAAMAGSGELGGQHQLKLKVGQSQVIDCPELIDRISTSNPEVVDAVAVSSTEVLLQARTPGHATIGIWGKKGYRQFYVTEIYRDLDPLIQLLREAFPQVPISVHSYGDAIALTGTVEEASIAEKAVALAAPFAKTVVNHIQVVPKAEGPKQVLLKVRFAELNRSAEKALGASLFTTGAGNTTARVTTGQFPAPQPNKIGPAEKAIEGVTGAVPGRREGISNFLISDALNVFAFRPDLNIGVLIQALSSQGLLQILAEPNLVALEGKEASFLVGGEFPVPIAQAGPNTGAISVSFREYGIRLTFRPQLTSRQTIRLFVRPEVSTIDLSNAVTLAGFTIPALATRRVETELELEEGQSFIVAGLIDDRAVRNLARMPGLARIPVLGAFFRSRQEKKSKTELIVIVTPSIVDSSKAAQEMPSVGFPEQFLVPGGSDSPGRRENR